MVYIKVGKNKYRRIGSTDRDVNIMFVGLVACCLILFVGRLLGWV